MPCSGNKGGRLKRFAGPNNHLINVESHVAKTFSGCVKKVLTLRQVGPFLLPHQDFLGSSKTFRMEA